MNDDLFSRAIQNLQNALLFDLIQTRLLDRVKDHYVSA